MRKLFGNKKIECPCPIWVPDRVEDIKIIYDRLAFYTNNKKHFVVYEYGTGVYPKKAECDPIECDSILMSVVMNPPNFKVTPMKDGNFLVGFKGPVYGVVLGDFYQEYKDLIINNVLSGGLLPGEKLLKPESDFSIPEDHYYIGLYARAKLYADAESHISISLVHDHITSA
jgi:hypothetical protein